ncbi:MAG: hypothetical protein JSS27_13550 [Planctomycetes bacterium]|nr:hypothetical protein [Planctomycetota bacterium]
MPSSEVNQAQHDDLARASRRWLWLAALMFVATRAYLVGWFHPAGSDADVYCQTALLTVDGGQVAYADVAVEYPPLAYAAIALPRWLAHERFPRLSQPLFQELLPGYLRAFQREMFAADLVAFACFVAVVWRRRPELAAVATWGYVLTITLLAHVLYQRLDVGLWMFVAVWAWGATRAETCEKLGWTLLATAALGLGAAYKVFPAFMAPAFLVATWRASGHASAGRKLNPVGVFALAVVLPLAVAAWSSEGGVWKLFSAHGARGLQIESTYASALMLLRGAGVASEVVGLARWTELQSTAANLLAAASPWITGALIMAVTGWLAILKRSIDRRDGYRWGLWSLAAAAVTCKVLSPQFMVWVLPTLLLLGLDVLERREFFVLVVLLVVAAALTTAVFPYHFMPGLAGLSDQPRATLIPNLDTSPVALLAARNALLVAITSWLGWRSYKTSPINAA